MKTWLTILISVPIGAFSSLIAWWILNYCINPKIRFSEYISSSIENSKSFYRFKFENASRRRMIDSEITAKLRIKGLLYSTNWEVIYLPIDNDRIPIIYSTKKGKHRFREVPRIELELIDPKYFRILPPDIKAKIENGNLLLNDLLKLALDSEIILIVSGYDEKSGAKKVFESKPYKIEDVVTGLFKKDSLEIQE
ncbi:MAG: hypothetical protein AB7S69_12085 [Salinivirgaceae bacterium]